MQCNLGAADVSATRRHGRTHAAFPFLDPLQISNNRKVGGGGGKVGTPATRKRTPFRRIQHPCWEDVPVIRDQN